MASSSLPAWTAARKVCIWETQSLATQPIFSDEARAARDIRRLPSSLGEAIEALQQDAVLLDALGSDLARSCLAVRGAEWEVMKDMPHEEEVRLLLERY